MAHPISLGGRRHDDHAGVSAAVMRIIRQSIIRLEASQDAEGLEQTMSVPLVELGHFDRVLY